MAVVSDSGQYTCLGSYDVCTGIGVELAPAGQDASNWWDFGHGSGGSEGAGLLPIGNLGAPHLPAGFSFGSLLVISIAAYIVVKKAL